MMLTVSGQYEAPAFLPCISCAQTVSEEPQVLPCLHTGHRACLVDWFRNSRTCPACDHFPITIDDARANTVWSALVAGEIELPEDAICEDNGMDLTKITPPEMQAAWALRASQFNLVAQRALITSHVTAAAREVLTPADEESRRLPNCSICDEAMDGRVPDGQAGEAETWRAVKTRCDHTFHRTCIGAWYDRLIEGQHPDCPECRQNLGNTTEWRHHNRWEWMVLNGVLMEEGQGVVNIEPFRAGEEPPAIAAPALVATAVAQPASQPVIRTPAPAPVSLPRPAPAVLVVPPRPAPIERPVPHFVPSRRVESPRAVRVPTPPPELNFMGRMRVRLNNLSPWQQVAVAVTAVAVAALAVVAAFYAFSAVCYGAIYFITEGAFVWSAAVAAEAWELSMMFGAICTVALLAMTALHTLTGCEDI